MDSSPEEAQQDVRRNKAIVTIINLFPSLTDDELVGLSQVLFERVHGPPQPCEPDLRIAPGAEPLPTADLQDAPERRFHHAPGILRELVR